MCAISWCIMLTSVRSNKARHSFPSNTGQSASSASQRSGKEMVGGLRRPVNRRPPSINSIVIFDLDERASVDKSSQREYGDCDRTQRREVLREIQQSVDSETLSLPLKGDCNTVTSESQNGIADATCSSQNCWSEIKRGSSRCGERMIERRIVRSLARCLKHCVATTRL